MKASRLIAYGVIGIIDGLIFENSALRMKQAANNKARRAVRDARKVIAKTNKAILQH